MGVREKGNNVRSFLNLKLNRTTIGKNIEKEVGVHLIRTFADVYPRSTSPNILSIEYVVK
jgi:hypothetical protein